MFPACHTVEGTQKPNTGCRGDVSVLVHAAETASSTRNGKPKLHVQFGLGLDSLKEAVLPTENMGMTDPPGIVPSEWVGWATCAGLFWVWRLFEPKFGSKSPTDEQTRLQIRNGGSGERATRVRCVRRAGGHHGRLRRALCGLGAGRWVRSRVCSTRVQTVTPVGGEMRFPSWPLPFWPMLGVPIAR